MAKTVAQPGSYNMQLGALWLISGIVLTLLFMGFALFWGAILVGFLQFTWGLIQWSMFKFKSEDKKRFHYAKKELRALIRSLVAMASADGKVSDVEILTIQNACINMIDIEIDKKSILNIAKPMKDKNYSFLEDLDSISSQLSAEFKVMIIRCSYIVAASDGKIEKTEIARLQEIGETLNVAKDYTSQIVRETKHILKNG